MSKEVSKIGNRLDGYKAEQPIEGFEFPQTEAKKPKISIAKEAEGIMDTAPGGETRSRAEVEAEVYADRVLGHIDEYLKRNQSYFGIDLELSDGSDRLPEHASGAEGIVAVGDLNEMAKSNRNVAPAGDQSSDVDLKIPA